MHLAKAQYQAGDHFPSPASKKGLPRSVAMKDLLIYFTLLDTIARSNLDLSANMITKFWKVQKISA